MGSTDFIFDGLIVSVRFFGELNALETEAVFRRIDDCVGDLPYWQLRVHMDSVHVVTPDARRIAADRLKGLPPRSIAIVGGSFGQRMIAKLVLKAALMIDRDNNEGRWFETDAEAETWLREAAKRNTRRHGDEETVIH